MTIPNDRFYYGAAAWQLESAFDTIMVSPGPHKNSKHYTMDNAEAVVLYKYRSEKKSPWSFSLSDQEANTMKHRSADGYVALICHDDGVCCVSMKELQKLAGSTKVANVTINVSRRKGGSYRLVASNGRRLSYSIRQNAWPLKIQ